MTRIRCWAISVATLLATPVAWTTHGFAETLSALAGNDATWQAQRPANGPLAGGDWSPARSNAAPDPDNRPADSPYGGAAWQASESSNVVPRPAGQIDQ